MGRIALEWLVLEDGPIEMATAVLYLIAAVMFWKRSEGARWSIYHSGAILLLAGGLRELDLHNRITSAYVFNTRYFVSEVVPAWELLIVMVTLAGLCFVFLDLVQRGWRDFIGGLRRGERHALAIAGGISLMTFTVGLDRLQGFVRNTYGPPLADVVFGMWFIEETLELIIPLLFFGALPHAPSEPALARRRAA
jgi:hypothetical protein